ncbi:MAG: metallophosphoesterase family protein [Thermodesulfobacteriota bacterium]
MKIVCFSDSHSMHEEVPIPHGDLLIFAGDMSRCREVQEAVRFNRFLATLPHPYKIVIGGNHDLLLSENKKQARELLSNAIYLEDDHITVQGIKIYGAPWQPVFNHRACAAFALPRGTPLRSKWEKIPHDVNILVTHTPPVGVMDEDQSIGHGCSDLLEAVHRVKPRYHIFGHIHNHNGVIANGTTFINCNVRGPRGQIREALAFDYSA